MDMEASLSFVTTLNVEIFISRVLLCNLYEFSNLKIDVSTTTFQKSPYSKVWNLDDLHSLKIEFDTLNELSRS